ncbi:hypothetical protein PXK56_18430 [Phaeobacter gallaeciensis]|uniref:hypothetical protein n=1 Tax=Phaeobacter gallaeciensis TaxID=60890 RepID=UPI002380351F|nr:hypothetical protein [Phaeobacter gallaeciensis]MDE4297165.1 hypothetical protein [Phaeobacter gallaeciensis]
MSTTDDIITVELTGRERDTILAALRHYQRVPKHEILDLVDIATNGDEHVALSGEEIDTLCEELNQ